MSFFNYDPITGIRDDFTYDEDTGEAKIIQSIDTTPLMERNLAARNQGATDKGIKNGMWHYASIDPITQIKLRQMGIDIYSKDPTEQNRLLKAIDEHFPYLKMTDKRHRVSQNRHL